MKTLSFAKRAVSVAALAFASLGANAATYDLGTLTAGAPKSFNAFMGGVGLTSFIDYFKFELLGDSITGGSVIEIAIPGVTGADLTSAQLYSGMPMSGVAIGAPATGTLKSLEFSGVMTPAGSYYLQVEGKIPNTNLSFGAAYNGAISVTAVPEPESYAMLLAGLGVMGAIAMRRNKRKTD